MTFTLRPLFFLLALLVVLPANAGAEGGPAELSFQSDLPRGTPRIKAACSLAPIQYVIDRIGGEYVDSLSLIPAGFDPHTFEPKTSQLQVLNQAQIYFSLNTPLEEIWINRVVSVNPRIRAVNLVAGLGPGHLLQDHAHDLAHEQEHAASHAHEAAGWEHEHSEHADAPDHVHEEPDYAAHDHPHYDGHDPHIWMSPYMLKYVAATVCAEFSRLMPKQRVYFEKNLTAFNMQLDNLDAYVKETLEGIPENKRSFLVFHPSWAYFAAEYNLTQIAVEEDGKEPTPASLAMVIQEARSEGISVIFVQKEFNPAVAATVAAHLPEGRVVALDPLGANPLQSIRKTADAIAGKSLDAGDAVEGTAE